MRIIVTGANCGVGKATAAALAAAGHRVVIACRSIPKAERAAAEMAGDVEVRRLDLADLTSVRAFADSIDTVDVLVNNAGVFGLPLTRTADGFEAHMGINHLGHFALTCLLGDKITDRVIAVVSPTYAFGRLDLDDLNWHTRDYSTGGAYAQSKLAIMLFVHELARRGVRAYACDPGVAETGITRYSTGVVGWLRDHRLLPFLVQKSVLDAARASIDAVTTDLPSGTCFAPRFKVRGEPVVAKPRKKARDPVMGRRLWELSAELTGCTWHQHPIG
jgi:NAD(P)-dependent dehydrogenase (short-subunit alcohol dehydrogenase family)